VLEADLREVEARYRAECVAQDITLPARVPARLDTFTDACKALAESPGAETRGAVNGALRGLCKSVVVDYRIGDLVFEFQHGSEAVVAFMFCWPREAPPALA
jgi:hypothetical protein